MTFSVGQRVLVHVSQGNWHDCSKPEQHWKSRVLSHTETGVPVIATDASRNPCHAEWPYTNDSLTLLDDGSSDWADSSPFMMTQKVFFTLAKATPQYAAGTRLEAVLEVPHIEPGDWYVSFPTPDGWLFKMVVPEKLLEVTRRTSFSDRLLNPII